MSETIRDVKASVRRHLTAGFERVPTPSEHGRSVHLEVWRTASGRTCAVGLEMGRDEMVNLWVATMDVPQTLPPAVKRTDKIWQRDRWTGPDGKGAHSNLKAYDDFRGKKITRLGVTSAADARLILEHLAR